MKWFVASLLFESTHSTITIVERLWEDRLILIQADELALAREKALLIGATSEHTYVGEYGNVVSWKFRQIERIFEIAEENLVSGIEVFSRFLLPAEAASLLSKIPDEFR